MATCDAKVKAPAVLAKSTGYNWCTYAGCTDSKVHTMLKTGPLAATIDANPIMSYKSGIFYKTSDATCLKANHAVVIVGYGYDTTTKTYYWLVRNSWGTSWGMSGYFRVRDVQNLEQDFCLLTTTIYQPYF